MMSDLAVYAGFSGFSALADTQQSELQTQWKQAVHEHRDFSIRWREEDTDFRELEKEWRRISNKRHTADEKIKQVVLLAELCSLISGFQTMMFFETEMPSLEEKWHSDVLLSVWGVSCLTITCSYVIITVASGTMAFRVMKESESDGMLPPRCTLGKSTRGEGVGSGGGEAPAMTLSEWRSRMYDPTGPDPDQDKGAVLYPEQFKDKWHKAFDQEFLGLIRLFSLGIPGFMFNLAMTILVKFDSSAAAQWTGFVTAVIGCLTWWRWWHSSAIPHLTFNPNAASHGASTERKAVRVTAQRVARQAEVPVEERSEIQVDSDDLLTVISDDDDEAQDSIESMLSSWNSSSMTSTFRKEILGIGPRTAGSVVFQREEDGRSRAASFDSGKPRAAATLSTIPSGSLGDDGYEGTATAGMMEWSEGEEGEEGEGEEEEEQHVSSQLGQYPVIGATGARRLLMTSPSLPTESGL